MEDLVFQQFSIVTKALSHANRLLILDRLTQRPYHVEELAEQCGISIANASQHLQQLKYANLVKSTRISQKVIYELKDAKVYEIITSVSRFCLHYNSDVIEFRRAQIEFNNSIKQMNMYKLFKKLGKKPQLIIDARPISEYSLEHIQGAISFHDQSELDRAKCRNVVVYGRNVLCPLAPQAASKLMAQGFNAKWLEGGYAEWKTAQLPIYKSKINS